MREKKAKDIVIFHVARLTTIADYFLICSAESQRQVKAIMENIQSALLTAGEKPFGIEGQDSPRWILMDYSDLIIHIFDKELRTFYALERLWGDAPRVAIGDLARGRRRAGPQTVKRGKAV